MLLINLFIFTSLHLVSCRQEDFFTAAVYEHIKELDPVDGVKCNLDIYEKVADEAAEKGVDILVFPEIGILPIPVNRLLERQFTETIPDPKTTPHWIPCLQRRHKNPILTRLSCIAIRYGLILVANIADEQRCVGNEPCRSDGVHIFNTDVAFDKNGTLVARYHKRFLFFEDSHDRPSKPNYITFDTEFGRFGLIACFDVLFNESVHLVENYDVDTIIAPAWWYDELPFLSAIQMFSGWARTQRVNVLLAGIHAPEGMAIGSGIFSWSLGALNYTHKTNNHSALLTAKLPRNDEFSISNNASINEDHVIPCSSSTLKEKYNYYITNMSNYTIAPLSNQGRGSVESCNNGLCCKLNYNSSSLIIQYYLAAHRGIRVVLQRYSWYEEVCTVFKCHLHSGTCMNISLDASTTFNDFHLQGNFSTKYVYPSVVGPHLTLTPVGHWNFSIHNNIADLRFKSGPPLLFATLFGRVYKDPKYHP